MAAMDTEFIVFLMLLLIARRVFVAHFPPAQLLLSKLRYWGSMGRGDVESLVPQTVPPATSSAKGVTKTVNTVVSEPNSKGTPLEDAVASIAKTVDRFSTKTDSSRDGSFEWNSLTLYDGLEVLLLVSGVSFALYGFSLGWSCLRGVRMNEMSFLALFGVIFVAGSTLVSGLSRRGLGHQEVQLSLAVGAIGFSMALGALHLPNDVFDVNFLPGLAELQTQTRSAPGTGDDAVAPADEETAVPATESVSADVPVVDATSSSSSPSSSSSSSTTPSPIFLFFAVALLAGVISTLQVLPTLRYARAYHDIIHDGAFWLPRKLRTVTPSGQTSSWGLRMLAHVAYFAPVAVALTWIHPVLAEFLLPSDLVKCSADSVARDCTATPREGFVFAESHFLLLQLALIAALVLLQFLVFRPHMQAYLRIARERQITLLTDIFQGTITVNHPTAEESAKDRDKDKKKTKAAGAKDGENTARARQVAAAAAFAAATGGGVVDADTPASEAESTAASAVVVRELERTAANQVVSLSVAAIDFLAPWIILLCLAAALLRKGEFPATVCPALETALPQYLGLDLSRFRAPQPERPALLETLMFSALANLLGSSNVARDATLLSPLLWRPLLSFLLFWFCASWFLISTFAFLYWEFQSNAQGALREEIQDTPQVADPKASKKEEKKKAKRKGD